MGLNIKNERVHDLARRAARLTGKTQTGAIEEALELLIAAQREDPEAARQERLDLLWQEIGADVTAADRAATRRAMAEMYDEQGLPR